MNPLEKSAEVTSEDGQVPIDGPDGLTSAMTPTAALKTAERLSDAAITVLMKEKAATARPEQ